MFIKHVVEFVPSLTEQHLIREQVPARYASMTS